MERYRAEIRRTASVFALSLAAAILGCTAAAFVALSVMLAFWSTHPVVASASIAVGLAVLAGVAVILARGRGSAPGSLHRE